MHNALGKWTFPANIFASSMSAIETSKKEWNMFKVNNNDTGATWITE